MTLDWFTQLDSSILFWIRQHLAPQLLDGFMAWISALGNGGAIWIALSSLLLVSRKYRRYGVAALAALLLGYLVGNVILKNVFLRPRPFDTFPDIPPLIPSPHGYSFPSGHTLSSFAAAGVFYRANRRFGIAALALAALIGFSRMHLLVHYPSDVLCGALLGLGSAFLCSRCMERFTTHSKKNT